MADDLFEQLAMAGETEPEELESLRYKISEARKAYYNSQPIMSDAEFDVLEDKLREVFPGDPLLNKVGHLPVGIWPKVVHKIPLGSLSKIMPGDGNEISVGIKDWWNKTVQEIRA